MSFTLAQGETLLKTVFAPWIQHLNLSMVAIDDNSATLKLPFSESLCRDNGVLCGQSLMALADTAAVLGVCAANGSYRNMTTVDQSIHLMKPVVQTNALARAEVVRLGRSMAFVRVAISTEDMPAEVAMAQLAYALLP